MANRNLNDEVVLSPRYALTTTVEGMTLRPIQSDLFKLNAGKLQAKIDPFATSTVQEYPLGTELWHGERKFRYALNGASSVGRGALVQSVVPLAGHIDEVCQITAVAGDTTITFTPNTVTTDDMAANEFADGYIYINDDTGEGYLYRIKSHPAITGGAAGTLTLYDPIVVATGASSTATIYHNRFRKTIIHPSPPTGPVSGVTVCAVGANEYHWQQYQGPAAVLTDGTLIIGCNVMPSDNVDGSVEHWVPETDTAGEVESMGPLGKVLVVNADTEYSLIWLAIA